MTSDDLEWISGKQKQHLLDQLKKEKAALQLVLIGRDYEKLTMISGQENEKGKAFLLIDCPRGFSEDVPEHKGASATLEFQGKDRVQYAFKSRIDRVSEFDIWLEMPEYIERVQRRQSFRISPPHGTKISFHIQMKPVEAEPVNLSEGGMLLHPLGGEHALKVGETIRNLRLRCRLENLSAEIKVEKALVRRAQTHPKTGQVSYALQFQEIDLREKRALREFILNCQREVLRRRAMREEE